MAKYISIVDILKQSGKFNLVNVVTNILSIPRSIIIAMLLVPKDFGIISFLGLWSMYATLINPGFLSARSREMAHLLGTDNEKEAIRIQNISHTSDMIYTFIPFLVILFASFSISDKILKIGFILTAFTYVFNHFVDYWRGVHFVKQHFSLVAKADLIKSVSTVVAILALMFWMKIYAVLVAPIIAAFLTGIYYRKQGKIGYQFLLDWPESVRLFKIGISLSLLSLAYWAYRFIDRTLIATFLPLDELGIYSYAVAYIFLGLTFLSDFGNVLTPVLWTKAGQPENRLDVFYDSKRIVVYLTIVTAMMIPLSQVCFYLLVQLLTKKYIGSIPIFIVLSCNLYLTTLLLVPSLILSSTAVNKQALSLKIYIIGLLLNIAFDIVAIRLGYSILSIALINVVIQTLITSLHFYLVRNYIFHKNEEFLVFILSIGVPFLLSIGFCFFHNYLIYKVTKPWFLGAISFPLQIIIWSIVITLFYPKYFSKDKINKVTRIFIEFVSKYFVNISKKLFSRKIIYV